MRKMTGTILAVGMACALLTGCGATSIDSYDSKSMSYMPETSDYSGYDFDEGNVWSGNSYASTEDSIGEIPASESAQVRTDRKLIRNVSMDVETKEYDQLMLSLDARVESVGGYIENMESYNGSSYSGYQSARYASVTIRVPQDKLDSFLEAISGICNVVRRSDSVDDVTLTYVDMESHRDMLKAEQKRLLELLEQAESLEDILTIESRLTDVRYQIESMEAQLRTMDNQVQYSTVSVYISEVQELTPVVTPEKSAWERISEGFMNSLESVGHGLAEFGIWLLIHIPQLVIWAAIIIVIVLLIKRRRKKKAARKQAAMRNNVMPAGQMNMAAQNSGATVATSAAPHPEASATASGTQDAGDSSEQR